MDNIKAKLKVLQYAYFSLIKGLINKDNNLDYKVVFDVCGDISSKILHLMLKLYTTYNMTIDEIIETTDMVFKPAFTALLDVEKNL